VTARTAARVEHLLRKHGRYLDEHGSSEHDDLADNHPVLASCYRAATAGQQLLGELPGPPVLRVIVQPSAPRPSQRKLVAEARGFNVHAERLVDGRDRPQLERLCRYLARPPLANERLQRKPSAEGVLDLVRAL
jgi:hypothetical protein